MRASIAFAVAALAGCTLAAPGYYGNNDKTERVKNVHVVVETVYHTVYMTEGQEASKPTPTPQPKYEAPVVTVIYEEPAKPTSPVYQAPAQPTVEAKKPSPQPSPTPAPPSKVAPAPSGTGYMAVVDEWRGKLGLALLERDQKLESNAKDTVVSSNGAMVHKLNPGSFGQVLAPGNEKDFEHVFVGGWLCELPNMAGLEGVCEKQSQGWTYNGQTGHAEILTNKSYKKIGCALHAGIWCCDVA